MARQQDSEFDRKYGVDTSGKLVPAESDVVGSNWLYGNKYHAGNATALDQILRDLPIRYEQFTFIDLGSGKGRAVLVASRFPFRKVIGVEYSSTLNEIARLNLARFPESEKRCKNVELVCVDAAHFLVPEGPAVIFLFNPFGPAVMKHVVHNVLMSAHQNPRRIVILYFNPVLGELWRNAGPSQELRLSKWVTIFEMDFSTEATDSVVFDRVGKSGQRVT